MGHFLTLRQCERKSHLAETEYTILNFVFLCRLPICYLLFLLIQDSKQQAPAPCQPFKLESNQQISAVHYVAEL